jgi:hypothetical protein
VYAWHCNYGAFAPFRVVFSKIIKKRWEKNTLRIKYVVYIAVSSVQQVTLEMHAEMRVSSRKMSFIGMTKLVVPNG